MCPSDPAAYPTYGGWEPAHLGTLTSSKKATKTYVNEAGETKTYSLRPDSPLLVWPFPQQAMETSNLVQNTK